MKKWMQYKWDSQWKNTICLLDNKERKFFIEEEFTTLNCQTLPLFHFPVRESASVRRFPLILVNGVWTFDTALQLFRRWWNYLSFQKRIIRKPYAGWKLEPMTAHIYGLFINKATSLLRGTRLRLRSEDTGARKLCRRKLLSTTFKTTKTKCAKSQPIDDRMGANNISVCPINCSVTRKVRTIK